MSKSAKPRRGAINRSGAPFGNQNAIGNRGGPGAPTLYHDGVPMACWRLALLGATDAEMADVLGVSLTTFETWKRERIELAEALRDGKMSADAAVAASLFQRAVGYRHEATKIFMSDGRPVVVPYTEVYPPDTTAARYWLNNRQRQRWRDREPADGQETPMTVNFTIIGLYEGDPPRERKQPDPVQAQATHRFIDPARR